MELLYYWMKKTSVRSLDCNAEVSAKVLRLMMSTLRRDETVHFFFFSLTYEYQILAQHIRPSEKHYHLKIPIHHSNQYWPVMTSIDHFREYWPERLWPVKTTG